MTAPQIISDLQRILDEHRYWPAGTRVPIVEAIAWIQARAEQLPAVVERDRAASPSMRQMGVEP